MARGKHANRAEAARARREAEIAAEESGRAAVRLEAEVAMLKEKLAKERAESAERLRHYAYLMEQGSSPEVERLRAEVATMRNRMEADRHDRAKAVMEVLGDGPAWISIEERSATRMAEALGVPVGMLLAKPSDTRELRRLSNRMANLNMSLKQEAAKNGGRFE